MTDPDEHSPTGGTGPDDLVPGTDVDAAELDALVQRLRTEPVEVDALARERRIAAALEAATYLDTTTPAGPDAAHEAPPVRPSVVPVARRGAPGRAWLTAAAVLAVLGIGGYFVVGLGGGTDGDESADSAATAASEDAAAPAPGAAEESASTTIAPSAPAVPLDDLGSHADAAALQAALAADADTAGGAADPTGRAGLDGAQVAPDTFAAAASSPCALELVARGEVLVGVALVDGRAVLVVRASPPGLVDAAACTPL